MVTILLMSAKLTTVGLLKVKVFWDKGYAILISIYDVTSNLLLRDSNYIADVVMWPKFDNSTFSMKEVIVHSIL